MAVARLYDHIKALKVSKIPTPTPFRYVLCHTVSLKTARFICLNISQICTRFVPDLEFPSPDNSYICL